MFRKISQVGIQITGVDLSSGCSGFLVNKEDNFIDGLSNYLFSKYVYLVNSGATAFYIILQALKDLSPRREVILPAYTAPSLVVVVLKAGLRPILCDISLDDFNMDLNLLSKIVTKDTLGIIPVYMFGIGIDGVTDLKDKWAGIYIIEDCAQALGTQIRSKQIGSFSDVSFFSFNRGKNLSTYGGGCIATNSAEIANKIKEKVSDIPAQNLFFKLTLPVKLLAFSLASRPIIYGLGYPFIAQFKNFTLPKNIEVKRYTSFQAGVGLSLLNRIEELNQKRYLNGMKLLDELKKINSIIVPNITMDTKPVFNRLPILVKNLALKDKIKRALWKTGVDSSEMYIRPLHHLFDLGYKKEDFPKANYFAERLITLPVHPLVEQKDLDKIIKTIKETVS